MPLLSLSRDDEKGKKKTFYFLPWHLGFLSRYRPFPPEMLANVDSEHPLIQTRIGLATGSCRAYEFVRVYMPIEKSDSALFSLDENASPLLSTLNCVYSMTVDLRVFPRL